MSARTVTVSTALDEKWRRKRRTTTFHLPHMSLMNSTIISMLLLLWIQSKRLDSTDTSMYTFNRFILYLSSAPSSTALSWEKNESIQLLECFEQIVPVFLRAWGWYWKLKWRLIFQCAVVGYNRASDLHQGCPNDRLIFFSVSHLLFMWCGSTMLVKITVVRWTLLPAAST